jgi:hypothetical protein
MTLPEPPGSDQELRSATPAAIQSALRAAGELGQFFRLADTAADPGGWQPVAALYEPQDSPLDEILATFRARLGGCEPRIAASVFVQGYAARLLSPQLACLVRANCLPEMPPGLLSWRSSAQTIELGMTPGSGWQAPGPVLLRRLIKSAFDEHLNPLSDALNSRVPVAGGVVRSNTAATIVAGLRLLDDGTPASRPWRPLAAAAQATPELRESGSLRGGTPAFVRRSCCLYYQAPGGGLCGDCPIPARA